MATIAVPASSASSPPPSRSCPECQLTFFGKKSLRRHIKNLHPEIAASPPPLISCPDCHLTFSKRKFLRRHKQDSHTPSPAIPPPLIPCPECQLTFSENESFLQHKQDLHPPTFPCPLCSMSCPSEKILKQHKEETHALSRTCQNCTITFRTKKELTEHKSKSHPPEFPCTLCHTTFSAAKNVRVHIWATHSTCGVCRQKFLGTKELQNHQLRTDHLRCPECDIIFDNRGDHKIHVRNVQHATEYRCCDCDRDYESQDSLDLHCCDCDRVFLSAMKLEEHFTNPSHIRKVEALANATAEEKDRNLNATPLHKCQTCKEMFPSKQSLKKHRLSKHKPRRHIKCPVGVLCIKLFASPSALLSHLESGGCKGGMTRAKMTELVFAHDPNHYITSPDAVYVASAEPEQ